MLRKTIVRQILKSYKYSNSYLEKLKTKIMILRIVLDFVFNYHKIYVIVSTRIIIILNLIKIKNKK